MYGTRPCRYALSVTVELVIAFAIPKSASRATPSLPTSTFCELTSRWSMRSG